MGPGITTARLQVCAAESYGPRCAMRCHSAQKILPIKGTVPHMSGPLRSDHQLNLMTLLVLQDHFR